MTRFLIAVSSIGYGHVARSRAIAKSLEDRGHDTQLLAPPPTGDYARAWGARVHPLSYRLEPLSPIVERWYERTGSAMIGLRMALEEQRVARGNARLVDDRLEWDQYDLILADESWELLESTRLPHTRAARVLLTDFIIYKPPTLLSLPMALAYNRYIRRRLPRFHTLIHVGLKPPQEESTRWMILWGPRISDWARENSVEHVGPLPALTREEAYARGKAREELSTQLGLPPNRSEEPWILAALGGTSAGYRELTRLAWELAKRERAVLVLALNPKATAPREENVYTLPPHLRPQLPCYLKAFDAALAPAGLTTLATHAALGLPTLAFPLPHHFEQEENARIAPHVLGDCITPLKGRPDRLPGEWLKRILDAGCRPAEWVFHNLQRAVSLLERLALG